VEARLIYTGERARRRLRLPELSSLRDNLFHSSRNFEGRTPTVTQARRRSRRGVGRWRFTMVVHWKTEDETDPTPPRCRC
jgi:hypothetical protein